MTDFETKQITYFKKPGKENTDKIIDLALEYAKKNKIKKIVVATYVGDTAMAVRNKSKGVEVIAVTLHAGTKEHRRKGWEANVEKLKKAGIICYRGTQTLNGVERAMNKRYGGMLPLMIFVDALKLLSEGVKVCVEITSMAADAGLVEPTEDIIAIAGTGGGADTAMLVQPAYSTDIYNMGLKEIICMPKQIGVLHDPR